MGLEAIALEFARAAVFGGGAGSEDVGARIVEMFTQLSSA